MWDVARKAFLGFAAVLVILLILNTGANAITVSNVTNATPMATTVWIIWNTSSEANNTVEYSINSDLSNSSFSAWNNNTNMPKIKLWSLQPNTTYYYRVWSYNATNESDNTSSSIYNFITQECVSYKLVNATDTSITGIDHPIQEALDMICLDGGVVELKEGTWYISDADAPILINRNNITLRGQGRNKTVIEATEKLGASAIRVFYTRDRDAWEDFWYNYCWIKYASPEDCNITNVTIEDIHIHGASRALDALTTNAGLDCGFTKNSTFRNLWIDNFGVGIEPWSAYYITIENNIIENVSCGLDCPFFHSTLKGNRFGPITGSNQNIKLNGGCTYNKIINNIIGPSNNDGLLLYMQSNFNEVINNTVYSNTLCGIRMANSRENLIKGNVVYSNGVHGISTSGSVSGSDWIGNEITGNIVYDNGGDGIKLNRAVGSLSGGTEKIIGNTIYSNSQNGIYTTEDNPSVIKNNIIVNNGEYGIKRVGTVDMDLSYNDVWNNTLDNYNGVSADPTDISADPLFADPANGDFHLKSEYGRWNGTGWVNDNETSPCIDAGDPSEKDPDGTRINMGAYGGTWEASKSPSAATGTLTGTVTDKDTSTPIEGAIVTANGYSNTTNSTGGYIITLAIGNYTVTASKTGYYSNSTTAQVLGNQTTVVDFVLIRHKRKLPVAKPVCATGIAILIVIAYWRYRRRRRRMRSSGFIVLVPGIIGKLMRF